MQYIFSFLAMVLLLCMTSQGTSQCIFPPVPDGTDCHDARYVCGYELDGFSSSLPDTILSEDYPVPFCPSGGNIDNMIWLSFFVCEEQIILNIIPDNCTTGEDNLEGIQVAMYEDCSYSNAVYCQVGGSEDPFVVVISDLIPGSLYYLLLDGNGGSICDFTIDVIDGVDTSPVILETDAGSSGSDTEISGPSENCAGSQAAYSFKAPVCYGVGSGSNCAYLDLHEEGFLCYEWTITPDFGYQISGDPSSEDIAIEWLEIGTYLIQVQSYINPSFENCLAPGSTCGNIESLEVEVLEQITNIAPLQYICEGDCIEFCGIMYCDPGVYLCDDGQDACIRTELTIEQLYPDTTDLGQLPLCKSGCFSAFDTLICNTGTYLIQDPYNCSVYYSFELFSTGVDIEMPVNMELNCSTTSLDISPLIQNPNSQTLSTYWLNSSGDTITKDNLLTVSAPGEYTFGVVISSFSDCVIEETINIIDNNTIPVCTWNIPYLNCNLPQATITFNNNPQIESMVWSGPNGYQSTDINPLVGTGGTYYVEVTGINGCIYGDTLEIQEDKTPLEAELTIDPLDCTKAFSMPEVFSTQVIENYLWSGPGNFVSINESPALSIPGWYSLELTAINGCTWTADFELQDISAEPVIIADTHTHHWNCNTNSLLIQTDIITGGAPDILWTTDDGNIIGPLKNSDIEVGSTGIYYLQVKDSLNGCTNQDTIFVIDNPNKPDAVDLEVHTPVCFGENNAMIIINEIIGGEAPYQTLINNEMASSIGIMDNLEPGIYELQITDAYGCIYEESVWVDEGPDIQLLLDTEMSIEKNELAEIELMHNLNSANIESIIWYDDAGKVIGTGAVLHYILPYSMQLKAVLTHQSGCTAEASIIVRVDEIDLGIFIPNVFSPNNDGLNDRFFVFADKTVSKIESMYIFDRWGSTVFSNQDFLPNDELYGWNGSYKGIKSSPGTYVYLVILEDKNGEKHNISGEVNLIR